MRTIRGHTLACLRNNRSALLSKGAGHTPHLIKLFISCDDVIRIVIAYRRTGSSSQLKMNFKNSHTRWILSIQYCSVESVECQMEFFATLNLFCQANSQLNLSHWTEREQSRTAFWIRISDHLRLPSVSASDCAEDGVPQTLTKANTTSLIDKDNDKRSLWFNFCADKESTLDWFSR